MFINYEKVIYEFLQDVKAWLNKRKPRDSTDVKDIAETKDMWDSVCMNPQFYVQYSNLQDYVANRERGFIVKRGLNQYDNSMLCAVNDVLMAMDKYYRSGGYDVQKLELAEAIKKYKMLQAKNAFERFKISLTKSEKLLIQKQK